MSKSIKKLLKENSSKNTRNKYEESAKSYTHSLNRAWEADGDRNLRYIDKGLETIEKFISEKKKNLCVIDIGCGTGNILHFLETKGYEKLYGIDINTHTLKLAQKRCPKAVIKKADVYKISFENNKFDLVIFTEVIEHLDYPQKAIKEIQRILKPGGILFLTTPNRMGLMGLSNGPIKFFTQGYYYKSVLRILGKITCGPEHPREYFSFELVSILKKYGFKTLYFPKISYIPLFPAGKYYLIAQKK